MFIYFKIRYLEADELEIEAQIQLIRNYVEKVCNLTKTGFKYKGFFQRTFKNEKDKKLEVAVAKYLVAKKADVKKIEEIMKKKEVFDELSIYVSLSGVQDVKAKNK